MPFFSNGSACAQLPCSAITAAFSNDTGTGLLVCEKLGKEKTAHKKITQL
jgi:hypothetical protein